MSSISSRCLPGCEVTCPEPCAYSRSLGSCVATCGDSRALVYAPPVLITFPGPILSNCPQDSFVGSSFPQSSGVLTSSSSRMGGSYGSYGSGGMSGMGALSGSGGSYGSGGMSGMGGYSGAGGSYGSGGMSGMGGYSGGCSSYGSGSSSGIGGCYSRRFYSTSSRGSRL